MGEVRYQGMYSRGIMDDKTRLLCMVGNCLAAGKATQARGPMRVESYSK